jgi:apolipoprotein N-acyltransferase
MRSISIIAGVLTLLSLFWLFILSTVPLARRVFKKEKEEKKNEV